MKKEYLAHTSEDGRKQTVLAHLEGTAALCEEFASAFGAGPEGRLAGLAHDLGKYTDAFQRRLLENGPRVDHASAGAFECLRLGQVYASIAAAGHHVGLPDGGTDGDSPDDKTYWAHINRVHKGKVQNYDFWHTEITLPQLPPSEMPQSQAEAMFFTRMLYSCLVDADFLDTEAFMEPGSSNRGGGSLEGLLEKLEAYISGWFPPKNALNAKRCELLRSCLKAGETQPGLFTLTIPTGGGKTAASLAFALKHAKANNLRRIIYVAPYTSIIEQNAQKFREILGEDAVLEHHSAVQYDTEDCADQRTIRLAKATENWDMPVVVTTAVQFFESLYASRSSRCRKLHNLADSVVILDEAQMLPVPYLRPCVYAIAQLVRRYGVSAVLCTATQPALGPIFEEFGCICKELCPPETMRDEIFRRTVYHREGALSWEDLAGKLNACQQVLCVVNTRKSAQTVYGLLEEEGRFHLSTLMCPAHRRAALEVIRKRLKEGLPCRVVSTSLIEAGVDVDFPAVFREEAGLDSILQAAGRCNREGKNPAEESIVTVFEGESPVPQAIRLNKDLGRQTLERFEKPDSPEAIAYYFGQLLEMTGKDSQDRGILPLMEDMDRLMPFRTVSERFKLIEDASRTVYVPWKDGAEVTDRLQKGERSRKLFREAGLYGVTVYENHFQDMDRSGALYILEDGSAVLTDPQIYSEETGLPTTVEGGLALMI